VDSPCAGQALRALAAFCRCRSPWPASLKYQWACRYWEGTGRMRCYWKRRRV
jgi:hypothetical protein